MKNTSRDFKFGVLYVLILSVFYLFMVATKHLGHDNHVQPTIQEGQPPQEKHSEKNQTRTQ